MKQSVLCGVAALMCILFTINAQGQQKSDYEIYAEKAGTSSLLYRGRSATKYPFVHNGTYYHTSAEYKQGDVFYNGKIYWDVWLNIDACQGDLLVKEPDGKVEHILPIEFVEWFTMGGETFYNPAKMGFDGYNGYFQELYRGKVRIFKRVEKVYSDRIANRELSGEGIPNFKQGVLKLFSPVESYYILKDGKLSQIRSKRDLLSHYKKDKVRYKAIRKYYREKEMGQERDFSRYCKEMMNFIESGDE